jgi:pimeloyl-ACP methyl ester carboxylesterase
MAAARQIVTFWSIEKMPCTERYHLGQLSVTQYADSLVAQGNNHLAIICDSDALGVDEYRQIYQMTAAIGSLCEQPVVIRTLTSLKREMGPRDRAVASVVASGINTLKNRFWAAVDPSSLRSIGESWRSGKTDSATYIAALPQAKSMDELLAVPVDELAGLIYLLTNSPIWYEDYWFASMQFAVNQMAAEFGTKLEIIEGERNRYVWLALIALDSLRLKDRSDPKTVAATLDLRPNVAADGSFGFMCLKEKREALCLHSSRDEVLTFCESASPRVQKSISKLLLGRNVDQPNLGVEIANRLAGVQQRWIFGADRSGPLRESPPQATEKGKRGLLSIHGILSRGVWQKEFSAPLSAEGIIYEAEDLGFLLPSVVLSRRVAVKLAKRIAERYENMIARYGADTVSIVAHSFGTRVLGAVLQNFPGLKMDKIILSGSILPASFPWRTILDRDQVRVVVNLVARHDGVVTAARILTAGRRGASGRSGFSDEHPRLFQPISPEFGHSDWLNSTVLNRHMIPLLKGDATDVRGVYSGYNFLGH